MKHKKLSIFMGLLLFLFTSCGNANDPTGEDKNPGNLDVNTNEFYGIWKGFLKDKRDNDAELIPVILTLNIDGTFKLALEKNAKAISEGKYEKFSDSIIFTAEISSISVFALQGNSKEYDFTLLGETLELFNNDSKMSLNLQDAFQGEDEDPAKQEGYIGVWQGKDRKANQWQVTINDGDNFSATISNARQLPLKVTGSYAKSKVSDGLNLEITSANQPDVKGSTLEILLIDDKTVKAEYFNQNGESIGEFNLLRK